jgi:hypothetical protein
MAKQVAGLGIDEGDAVGAAALQRYGHAVGRKTGAGDARALGFVKRQAGNRARLRRHSVDERHANDGDAGHDQDAHANDQRFQG